MEPDFAGERAARRESQAMLEEAARALQFDAPSPPSAQEPREELDEGTIKAWQEIQARIATQDDEHAKAMLPTIRDVEDYHKRMATKHPKRDSDASSVTSHYSETSLSHALRAEKAAHEMAYNQGASEADEDNSMAASDLVDLPKGYQKGKTSKQGKAAASQKNVSAS